MSAELIEMTFGRQTPVGPRNHVLVGVHIGATWQIRSEEQPEMRPVLKLL